jgi:hypothetical protein
MTKSDLWLLRLSEKNGQPAYICEEHGVFLSRSTNICPKCNKECKKPAMKIIKNPAKYDEITLAVANNDGYCPCLIEKNEDTKCICKEFREQGVGLCRCGRYEKVEV